MRRAVSVFLLLSAALSAGEAAAPAAPKQTPRQKTLAELVDLAPLDPVSGLDALVPPPTGAGNAAVHYAKLETLYAQDRRNRVPEDLAVKPEAAGLAEIFAASKIKECRLTPEVYPAMDKGTAKQPDVGVYLAYLQALLERAEATEKAGDLQGASALYRAGLVWGRHLALDRPNLVTYMLSLSILRKTSVEYGQFLQRNLNLDKAHAVDAFTRRIVEERRRVSAKSQVYLGDFRRFNCLYSVIRIAKEDTEQLWRQEAVLRLGVLRHGAPDADGKDITKDATLQRIAEEALMQVGAKDPAPWIRQLAVWVVANVTPDRFAEMRRRTLSPTLDEAAEGAGSEGEKAGGK